MLETKKKGEAVLQELGRYGSKVCFFQGDISKTKECQRMMDQVIAEFGRLDLVINSAGIYQEKSIDDMEEEDFDQMMDINIKGTYFICKYALPYLRKAGGGAIVNVSSDAGINGNSLCTAYCASKGAVTIFTKALSLETIHSGIRANCVCPGDVETPMLEKQLTGIENPTEYLRDMASIYPIGRIAKPQEVANVICFLLSNEAAFVNGAVWAVDGGLTSC